MWVEKHGPTWRIRDRVGGRPVTIAKGYQDKTKANEARKLKEADKLRGDLLAPGVGEQTLDEWLDEWWPHHEASLKPTSRHSEGGRVRNHIRPLLGGYTLGELEANPMIVQQWVTYLGSPPAASVLADGRRKRTPLGAKTVHNVHGVLHTVLDAAVGARRIRTNPCGVSAKSLPVRQQREMRFLTDPEIARLIAAMPPHWRPLVLLLVATGLRWGEAIGLRVRNVDLLAKRPQVRVVEHLHELSSTGELVWTDPKSAKSRRTVSFTTRVALALTPLVTGKDRDAAVFATPTGLLIRTRNFRRIWTKACEAAGLPGLRVHDLRHTHAAILIAAGTPLSAISRRLGHSSIAVTDTLYGHIREEVTEELIAAVEEALAKVELADLEAEVEAEFIDELAACSWEHRGSSGPGTTGNRRDQRGGMSRSTPVPRS